MNQQHGINTVEDFLNHRSSDRSGGYLSKWRKSLTPNSGQVDVFLHRKRMPIAIWRHGAIPRLKTWEDRKTGQTRVEFWGGDWVCWEDEGVLQTQFKRNEDGSRVNAPRVCSLCKLTDLVYEMMNDGEAILEQGKFKGWKRPPTLRFYDPIFRFIADDPSKSVVIHAGALVGEVPEWKELTDEEKEAVKSVGFNLGEAWKLQNHARLHYGFLVADVANVQTGLQIAVEKGMLGDRLKTEVAKAMKSAGPEKGNPWLNPYAFRWEYDGKKEIQKMYDVTRMENIPCTPDIEKLISGPVPDLSPITRPFNQTTMRALLEQAVTIDLKAEPWVTRWPELWKDLPKEEPAGEAESFPHGANAPAQERTPEVNTTQQPAQANADEPVQCADDEGHGCGATIKMSDHTCPHCGYVWDAAAAAKAAKAPPQQQRRKRGKAAEETTASPTPEPAQEPAQGRPGQPAGKGDKLNW